MEIPIFNFKLRPVDEIEPWGAEPHLGYYGLTDGCFWIRAGDDELFRYTDTILDYWKNKAAKRGEGFATFGVPYDDYQVMRYEDDLNTLLAAALEPIPVDIAELIPRVSEWRNDAPPIPAIVVRQLNARAGEPISPYDDLFYGATDWWRARQFQVMHLANNPTIYIWQVGDEVTIRWDNRKHIRDGIPVWTAQLGQFHTTSGEFIVQFKSFRQRFIQAMRLRVDYVKRHWSRPTIRVDLDAIEAEQAAMERSIPFTCSHLNKTNWDEVRQAMQELQELATRQGGD